MENHQTFGRYPTLAEMRAYYNREDFDVCYRIKYSGVRSLHLMIPFEAFPEEFEGKSIVPQHDRIFAKVKAYFGKHCGMKRIDSPKFLRLAYSLNEDNGLVSLPLVSGELRAFRPWQTHIHNVTVDKMWHSDVPTLAVQNTQRFLRAVFNDVPPAKPVQFGLNILPVTFTTVTTSSHEKSWVDGLKSETVAERVQAAW